MAFVPETWPAAKHKGQAVYIVESLDGADEAVLRARGWNVVDVRLMANTNLDEKRAAWFAYMEGIRLGTIECDPKKFKFVETEGRALKLLSSKELADSGKRTGPLQSDDISVILDFAGAKTTHAAK